MSVIAGRLETLIIARAFTVTKPVSAVAIAKALRRFAPTTMTDVAFREAVETALGVLRERAILDAAHRLVDHEELARRIGKHTAKDWRQLADGVIPALALGVSPAETKTLKSLKDDWAVAIAARALGLWTDGPPPTLAALGNALVWRELGISGKPRSCPVELRAHFMQQRLTNAVGSHPRQVRLLAAREVDASRAEPSTLRDALVRGWLTGREVGAVPSFADDVLDIARSAREGVFGDRKVFISTVWDRLRHRPAWSSITLEDFKSRLVTAHRAKQLELARADLVAAMDPALVAASETTTDGACFHFIDREAS